MGRAWRVTLACGCAVAAALAGGCGSGGSTTATTSSAPAEAGPRTLVLVGDSLAVGIRSLLPALLPGWRVRIDGRGGRPLADGMAVLAGTELPSDGSAVLAISLFTNDDPAHTGALEAAARQTLRRAGARGCVVWASIARPPLDGVTVAAANRVLARLAEADPRLRLVPWAREVAAHPSLLGPDGVHPTPDGYRLRAELYAQAARSC
jgi:lysophospholipase L1-like esterase